MVFAPRTSLTAAQVPVEPVRGQPLQRMSIICSRRPFLRDTRRTECHRGICCTAWWCRRIREQLIHYQTLAPKKALLAVMAYARSSRRSVDTCRLGGTDLGLVSSRQLAGLMRGTARARSARSDGSTCC